MFPWGDCRKKLRGGVIEESRDSIFNLTNNSSIDRPSNWAVA